MIETTKQDYLRVIYHFVEEQGDEKKVNSVDIAKYMSISKSSVSEMLRKLVKEDLIKPIQYGKVIFTKKGLKESIDVTKKHRIIEVFLSEILKINKRIIHDEAHRLEHAFSKESISAIEKLIKNTKNCPHGKPIPK